MFGHWHDAGMLNGDFVEWLETVNGSERFAIFLHNMKPLRLVRGVGRLINICVDLLVNDCANFFIETWGNGDITLYLGCVWNDRELDQREEIGMEATVFFICPSKTFVV